MINQKTLSEIENIIEAETGHKDKVSAILEDNFIICKYMGMYRLIDININTLEIEPYSAIAGIELTNEQFNEVKSKIEELL